MKRFLYIALLLGGAFLITSQTNSAQTQYPPIMFWNVENLFDTSDDPQTNDDEFTPWGDKHWTKKRLESKRNAIVKTIFSVKEEFGDYPYILGVAEIENKYVINELTENTILTKLGYSYVHRNSHDSRGIECALLYRKEYFKPLQTENVGVKGGNRKLRHILYVKGFSEPIKDTVHLFIAHFPSKLGGEKASEPNRKAAALALIHKVDSLYSCYQAKKQSSNNTLATPPKIVAMGDFNDTPTSAPIMLITAVAPYLKNMAAGSHPEWPFPGTNKYQGSWELIDQFIISEELSHLQMMIYAPDFLLENDDKHLDKKPFRTYSGPRYLGGVSDHLPIILR